MLPTTFMFLFFSKKKSETITEHDFILHFQEMGNKENGRSILTKATHRL